MVKITNDAPMIILEGDEYLSSPIDKRPKFHLYMPQLALISGIAWDHINVFPTYQNYVEQFEIFARQINPEGTLIYCETDSEVKRVCTDEKVKAKKIGYGIPAYEIRKGITYIQQHNPNYTETVISETPLQIFGEHNLMNLNGARLICNELGINDDQFYNAIITFKGAARRLELLGRNDSSAVYKDFAHSPSKLKATIEAVKQQYPAQKLIACMELHTFSSLNQNFLDQYSGSMNGAHEAIVYFNPHTIAHKKLQPITEEQVRMAFSRKDVFVFTSSADLKSYLQIKDFSDSVLLMMSSGTFDGLDLKALTEIVLTNHSEMVH
jgi:UDP-N-acetylmuramate: L-alanyl-gamma-D-glutamyl-meso-diaminopimelate ligase